MFYFFQVSAQKLTTLILRYVIFNITNIMIHENAAIFNTAWSMIFTVSYIVVIPIMPRFIISMRELYDHDCCSRWKGIDSRFGVLSQPTGTASPNVVMSAIAFAGVTFRQGESQVPVGEGGVDDPEVIRPEILGDASGAHQLGEGEAENSQAIEVEDRVGHV